VQSPLHSQPLELDVSGRTDETAKDRLQRLFPPKKSQTREEQLRFRVGPPPLEVPRKVTFIASCFSIPAVAEHRFIASRDGRG